MKIFNKKTKELEEKNEELKIKLRGKEFDCDMAVNKICILSRELEKSRKEATKYKDLYLKQIDINISLVDKGGD